MTDNNVEYKSFHLSSLPSIAVTPGVNMITDIAHKLHCAGDNSIILYDCICANTEKYYNDVRKSSVLPTNVEHVS